MNRSVLTFLVMILLLGGCTFGMDRVQPYLFRFETQLTASAIVLEITLEEMSSFLQQAESLTSEQDFDITASFDNATAIALHATTVTDYIFNVTNEPEALLTPPPTQICVIGIGSNAQKRDDQTLAQTILTNLQTTQIAVESVEVSIFETDKQCEDMETETISVIISLSPDSGYSNLNSLKEITGQVVPALLEISLQAPRIDVVLQMPTILEDDIREQRVVIIDYILAQELYASGVRGNELARAAYGVYVYPYGCEMSDTCGAVPPTPFAWNDS